MKYSEIFWLVEVRIYIRIGREAQICDTMVRENFVFRHRRTRIRARRIVLRDAIISLRPVSRKPLTERKLVASFTMMDSIVSDLSAEANRIAVTASRQLFLVISENW